MQGEMEYANYQAQCEAEAQAKSDSAYAQMEAEEQNKIAEEKRIDEITESLYQAYGSGTGVLFGIPSDLRASVRAIVKLEKEKRIIRLVDMCNQLHSKFSHKLAEKMLKDIVDMDSELYALEILNKQF